MADSIQAQCLADLDGIRHGFFTREGGVSDGIYGSLNCGHGSQDATARVAENRRRVASSLDQRTAEQVLTLYQVHSACAVVVDRPMPRDALPRADALVTATPGLIVAALAADCTPVLFADPANKVVAAAHAGWRGALSGILEATLEKMEWLGAQRSQISAAVGPSINQPAYQVGPEFEAAFLDENREYARFFSRSCAAARPHFDLPGFVAFRLRQAGLRTVEQQSPCTRTNDSLFFSYRRSIECHEPDYGRQISAIVVT